jgi:hypothetical protein
MLEGKGKESNSLSSSTTAGTVHESMVRKSRKGFILRKDFRKPSAKILWMVISSCLYGWFSSSMIECIFVKGDT